MNGWNGRIKNQIQMTNKKQFDRSINMLFPMKIDGSEDIEDKTEDRSDESRVEPEVSKTTNFRCIKSAHTHSRKNTSYKMQQYYTNGMYTKVFPRVSLLVSIVSGRTTITEISSKFGLSLNIQRRVNGIALIELSLVIWVARSQMPIDNNVLSEDEIFSYDVRGLVSNPDNIENCMVQKRKCITNVNIVLWNSTDAINHCIEKLEDLTLRDELQTSLIINEETIQSDDKLTTKQLLMMETSPDETFHPKNAKLQYVFDSLRREFLQQLKQTYQKSCQNRNNLLNPTLVARLMLQRNDVIIKRSLLLSPCKSKELTIENMEFNEVPYQQKDESLWQEISEQGEELAEFESVITHWTLITICIGTVTISLLKKYHCSSYGIVAYPIKNKNKSQLLNLILPAIYLKTFQSKFHIKFFFSYPFGVPRNFK
ncbi:unnamed protein product [Wuchereria bancrofti]|uniref:Uncharacterized protein n=1 Tax=Wuchereria bancrofti TaxID=6293 RepID=A0A3P7DPH6_WUCBA|nr:unnamed protein product [Wuchereria bancrofti]